jgi:predicted transcriptional regulator|tara:strand:+ start:4619 stop:5464 length:846 start_codon:yes stop_codon:yes gene_type:complete
MFILLSRSDNDALLLEKMSIAARERLFAVSVVRGTPAIFGARPSRFLIETLFCYGYLVFAMAERITRASCKFCQDEGRDSLEEMLKGGIITVKQLDKDMDWREGTADRHFRNHMGEYHMNSNSECKLCVSDKRENLEMAYFNASMTTQEIAEDVQMAESSVYHHLKHHLKPVVQKGAADLIIVEAGKEMDSLRTNLSRINGELGHFLDDADRNDPQYVRNIVSLHKEVRETIKDMLRVQERAAGSTTENMTAQTINILKVELAKESPEIWARLRGKLMGGE